jgi:uncharacterized protein (TIGR02594 family)
MQTRRSILFSAIGLALSSGGASAAQPADQDIGVVPELPEELRQYKDRDDLNQDMLKQFEAETKGLEPALLNERKTAIAIEQQAPSFSASSSPAPIEVARYFVNVAQDKSQKFPADWPSYMLAWPVRANPLIVEFFNATRTKPVGDMTAWCSAFVNWCFLRSRAGRPGTGNLLKPTENAASSSWRNWGQGIIFDRDKAVPKNGIPRVGDIVVFTDRGDSAHGHVCFFLALEGRSVRVVGGNQLEGKPVRHVISEKLIPLWGNVLQIHSIRTDVSLHPSAI